MKPVIDTEQEEGDHWIAEISALPGVLAYGATKNEASVKAKALALRVIADRLENSEQVPQEIYQLLLRDFFSAYFHEDWPCEAESPEAVVAEYIRATIPSNTHILGEAIREYCKGFANDRELEERLFTDLGCYFRPSVQGVSARTWLEDIANQFSRKNRN